MIYFLDRLAEFDAGVQGRGCQLHKINADVYVVCNRCRKKHCICARFFQSSFCDACDNNFESFHEDVALAWYLFVSSVRQSLSTSPMEIPAGLEGWAGWGGLGCGIEKLKTYSTYHPIPDDYSSRLFLE